MIDDFETTKPIWIENERMTGHWTTDNIDITSYFLFATAGFQWNLKLLLFRAFNCKM